MLLFLLLITFASEGYANGKKNLLGISELQVYYNAPEDMTLQQAVTSESLFVPQSKPYLANGGCLWVRIDPVNWAPIHKEDYYFSLIGNASEVDLFYYKQHTGWVHERNGTSVSLEERSMPLQHPVFDLANIDQGYPIYLRLSESIVPLIAFEDKETAAIKDQRITLYTSLILGFLLFIIVINLYRGFTSREWIFVLYASYIFSFFLAAWGFNYLNSIHLVFDISPYGKHQMNSFAVPLMNISGAWYGIMFLRLKENNKVLFYLLISLMVLTVAQYFGLKYIPNLAPIIGNIGLVFLILLLLVAGIMEWMKGRTYVVYYVIAYLIFGTAHISYTWFRNTDPVYPYEGVIPFLFVGFVAEALLLNLSLNRKLDHERELALTEKNQSQKALVELKEEQNKLLESQVEQRTRELSETLETLKSTQSKLIESEKMASLGILSAGVGHEINNPLNYIRGGAHALGKFIDEDSQKEENEELSECLEIINDGVNRATKIVKSLAHFSRQDDSMHERCSIHDILDNCLVILNFQLQGKVTVVKDYYHESLVRAGNEGKLHQVFLNIILNAEQAIEESGEIKISTDATDDDILITIKDNGVGIESDKLGSILDPFYTTKDPGKGTGLGLSIANNIIKEHGGKIEVVSAVGVGTEMKVILPR